MNLRLCLFVLVLGVLLVATQGAPADDGMDFDHKVQGRAGTRQTVEDALNIPIAALEAVQRLLNNLFSSRASVDVRKQ